MSDIDSRLLDRYLAGECTPDEAATVQEWIVERPEERAAFLAALRSAAGPTERATRWDADAAWRRVSEHIRGEGAHSRGDRAGTASVGAPRGRSPASGPVWRQRAALALAAALLIAVAALVWWRVGSPGSGALRDVATGKGERTELRLADGSRVILGVESSLRYPVEFERDARDVQLTGEAYFQVAHAAERPFTVRAANSLTRVLGTEFTVRAYADAPEVRVVVASGRVSLRDASSRASVGAVLAPGQLGRLSREGRTTVDSAVDVGRSLAWTTGEIVLDNASLGEAVAELRRWYDVDLAVGDASLAGQRVTAVFRGESAEQVIEAIALSVGARVERSGTVVRLVRRP